MTKIIFDTWQAQFTIPYKSVPNCGYIAYTYILAKRIL